MPPLEPQWKRLCEIFERAAAEEAGTAEVWRSLNEHLRHEPMRRDTVLRLLEFACREKSVDVRTLGIARFLEVWFQNNFFRESAAELTAELTPRLLSTGTDSEEKPHAVVVVVNDGRNLRDGQALLKLGSIFSHEQFRAVDLLAVPPSGELGPSTRWSGRSGEALERADVVCFVGRSTMFHDCPILRAWHGRLRYQFPEVYPRKRGSKVTRASAAVYHHLRQGPFTHGPSELCFPAIDHDGERTEHAVVQRFGVEWRKKWRRVIVVAGTTSLGTGAAAGWLARKEKGIPIDIMARLFGGPLTQDGIYEVLLRTKAPTDLMARPWHDEVTNVESLVINNGRNELGEAEVRSVTALLRTRDPATIEGFLINDEFCEFDGKDAALQLLALCLHCKGKKGFKVQASILRANRREWPKGDRGLIGFPPSRAHDSIRNHLQGEVLHDAIRLKKEEKDGMVIDTRLTVACRVDVKVCGIGRRRNRG